MQMALRWPREHMMCVTFPTSHSYTRVCRLQCAAKCMQTHMPPARPCVRTRCRQQLKLNIKCCSSSSGFQPIDSRGITDNSSEVHIEWQTRRDVAGENITCEAQQLIFNTRLLPCLSKIIIVDTFPDLFSSISHQFFLHTSTLCNPGNAHILRRLAGVSDGLRALLSTCRSVLLLIF